MPTFTLLHTSDLHNRLTPAAARRLVELKRERPGALLLDAGDAVGAGNLGFSPRGEPILQLMARTGYDAMAMGNRESHLLRAALRRKLRDGLVPVLAANVVVRRAPLPEIVRPYTTFATPQGPVAVIGLAPQVTRPDSHWAPLADYVFEDPVAVAADLAQELRPRAALVVCLSHSGEEIDRGLSALPEVDLVLGGHSHNRLAFRAEGDALVVHAGHHGTHAALTELTCRDDARAEFIALEPDR